MLWYIPWCIPWNLARRNDDIHSPARSHGCFRCAQAGQRVLLQAPSKVARRDWMVAVCHEIEFANWYLREYEPGYDEHRTYREPSCMKTISQLNEGPMKSMARRVVAAIVAWRDGFTVLLARWRVRFGWTNTPPTNRALHPPAASPGGGQQSGGNSRIAQRTIQIVST